MLRSMLKATLATSGGAIQSADASVRLVHDLPMATLFKGGLTVA
jgi:hypothetical protein